MKPDAGLPQDGWHPLTLSFRDPALEAAYRQDQLPRVKLQARFALIIGIPLYLLVGVLDPWFFSDARLAAWWIRIGAMSFPLLLLAYTFHPRFGRLGQAGVNVVGFAPGLGGVALLSLMTIEAMAQYYVAFVIVMFWTYLFIGIRFVHALVLNGICMAVFYVVFAGIREMPAPLLASSAFFLAATTLVGAGAAYLLELQQRVLFLRNRQLEREREGHRMRSLHDSLTGLPNRDLLLDRLEQAIAAARRSRRKCAGMYMDLDGFKPINDRYGHEAGDEVLKALAVRLAGLLREADTLARLGGDEFYVLAHDIESVEGAELIARRLLAGVAEPILLSSGAEVRLGVSIGICLFPYPDCTAHDIIHRGDHSMYAVKRSGKNGFAFSAPRPDESATA